MPEDSLNRKYSIELLIQLYPLWLEKEFTTKVPTLHLLKGMEGHEQILCTGAVSKKRELKAGIDQNFSGFWDDCRDKLETIHSAIPDRMSFSTFARSVIEGHYNLSSFKEFVTHVQKEDDRLVVRDSKAPSKEKNAKKGAGGGGGGGGGGSSSKKRSEEQVKAGREFGIGWKALTAALNYKDCTDEKMNQMRSSEEFKKLVSELQADGWVEVIKVSKDKLKAKYMQRVAKCGDDDDDDDDDDDEGDDDAGGSKSLGEEIENFFAQRIAEDLAMKGGEEVELSNDDEEEEEEETANRHQPIVVKVNTITIIQGIPRFL